MPKNRNNLLIGLAVGLSLIGYLLIGYEVQRPETSKLLIIYAIIFVSYLYLGAQKAHISIKQLVILGVLFRLIFLFSIPALSDDFYRFIWDGRLFFNGINPFAELPTYYINNPNFAPKGINKELFQLLNSPTHYTVYPPIPQFINWVAAWLATDSIWLSALIMRLAHLLAEIGTLILFPTVLKGFNINSRNMAWYAFNPLIIIELVGNLHHEALMIFFLILFLANMQQNKIKGAAFSLAMGVAAKLLPLVFLPYILLKLKGRKKLIFSGVFALSLIVVFAPLIDLNFYRGIKNSLTLYYQQFEFNAGIYYVFREVGFWIKGYNTIAIIGKIFAIGTTISILVITAVSIYKKWSTPITFLWISVLFALFSLILHPWYIALIILFGSMSSYRFGVLWSLLIMGTYAGYSASGFTEIMPVVATEFILVIIMLLAERKKQSAMPA